MAIGGEIGPDRAISSVEVLGHTCNMDLPKDRFGYVSVTTGDRKTLVCGGRSSRVDVASCLEFNYHSNKWSDHSSLTKARYYASAISMPNGVYVLGGRDQTHNNDIAKISSEFLPTGSTKWVKGPTIPGKGVYHSCIAKLSDTEFVILGGGHDKTQARVYNVETATWREWPRLTESVEQPSCVTIKDSILMVGGRRSGRYSGKTTIFDLSGRAKEISPLKHPRDNAAIVLYGEDRVLILGGQDSNGKRKDGEMWSLNNKNWEDTDISLNIARSHFSLVRLAEEINCNYNGNSE